MVAYAGHAVFACKASTLVVLIGSQVDAAVRASARAAPHSRFPVVDDLVVGGKRPPLRLWRTDHLAKSALILAARAFTLNAAITANAPAHVALVTNSVDSPVGTGAHTSPNTDRSAHGPVNHVPRHLRTGMISRPLESVKDLVRARHVWRRVNTLKQPPQHVVTTAKPMVRHNVAVLFHIGSKPLAGAHLIIGPASDARKVNSKGFGAAAHGSDEAGIRVGRVAAQLQCRAELVQLMQLPRGRQLARGALAIARHYLGQLMLSVGHAQTSGAAIKVDRILAPHVLMLAQVYLRAFSFRTDFVQNLDGESICCGVVDARRAEPSPHEQVDAIPAIALRVRIPTFLRTWRVAS